MIKSEIRATVTIRRISLSIYCFIFVFFYNFSNLQWNVHKFHLKIQSLVLLPQLFGFPHRTFDSLEKVNLNISICSLSSSSSLELQFIIKRCLCIVHSWNIYFNSIITLKIHFYHQNGNSYIVIFFIKKFVQMCFVLFAEHCRLRFVCTCLYTQQHCCCLFLDAFSKFAFVKVLFHFHFLA